jgi:hypothetical protein
MYYAKIDNGQFVKRINISDEVPDITFTEEPTDEQLAPYSVVIVRDAVSLPDFDPNTHGIVDAVPVLAEDGKWYATYTVIERGPDVTPTPPESV